MTTLDLSGDLKVAAGYDRWAATYDTAPNPTRDASCAAIRAAGLDLAGKVVLELGCGTGLNTVWLAERARRVTAVDFSAEMQALAKGRLADPHVEFVLHDLRQPLPFPDAAFDLVVETLVLEHLADLAPVFAEVRRVLRPGGTFFLCELHPFRQLAGKQARILDPAGGGEMLIEAFQHTISEFLNTARDTGLRLLAADERGVADDGGPRVLALTWARD